MYLPFAVQSQSTISIVYNTARLVAAFLTVGFYLQDMIVGFMMLLLTTSCIMGKVIQSYDGNLQYKI